MPPNPNVPGRQPALTPSDGIGGLVLAGGKSTRMGRSKAHLQFGHELMLKRVVRILGQVVHPIVVVGSVEQPLPLLAQDVIMACDEMSERGPLQGLAAGLKALEGRCEAAYACSCDVPLLKPQFVLRMIDLLGSHQIVVPQVGDYYEPLAAVYRLEVLAQVNELLNADRRRPVFLFASVDTRTVQRADLVDVDPQLDSLRNCNRPEDFQQALVDAGLSGG